MFKLLAGRRLDVRAERVLFALVANRALEPLSKLAATKWMAERAAIPDLDAVDDDACYRAMDWLLEVEADLAEAVYFAVADLLDLEVDLLFFDTTTSTYFEIDRACQELCVRARADRSLCGAPSLGPFDELDGEDERDGEGDLSLAMGDEALSVRVT